MKKNDRRFFAAMIALLALLFLMCGAYLVYNYVYMPRKIEDDNARYAALYSRTASPEPAATSEPTATAEPTPVMTAAPTATPTPVSTPEPTCTPSPTPAPTDAPTPELTAASYLPTVYPEYTIEPGMPAPEDILFGTPNADTYVLTGATLPPVSGNFTELLSLNPETVGFLTLSNGLELPVVQRENDNVYYLEHDFEKNESSAGCLFVDGMNWLYPRDDVLYVYGHNMKNGAMFGNLTALSIPGGLINASPVYFDTLYETGVYVPFACFSLTADQDAKDYFEIRKFSFSEESFAEYVADMKKLSILDIPVDVQYGDRLLVLVTCSYSIEDGRFAVALRQLREGESLDDAMALVRQVREK